MVTYESVAEHVVQQKDLIYKEYGKNENVLILL